MKKILTLDDLVKFCEEKNLTSFNSKNEGHKIFVHVPATFEKEKDDDSFLLYANVKAFHTGRNRNGSDVTEKAAKKAMKTMAYKPILANFTVDENGNADFTSHDMELDEDGNVIYLEHQIGCFTADDPYFEEDEDHEGRKYVMARAAIPREYTEAADIIERKNGTKVSVELAVNEFSYSAKDKTLILEDIEVCGLTLLGIDPDTGKQVSEGMEGARLDIEDFASSIKVNNDERTIEIIQELKQTLDNYISACADKNIQKGGNNVENFENVEVTETSEDEVVEEMAAEEVEETEAEESTEEVVVTEAESNDVDSNEENTESEEESETSDELTDNFAELSVTINGETKTFSCSLVDKLNALYELVNDTYGESDNEWYSVDADEDHKEVYMIGYFTGRNFKQKYTVKKDVFSLQGDRVQVYARYLTDDEIKQLDDMKSNYSSLEDRVNKFESEPEKLELLNSDEYSQIKETEEYAEISKRENYFDLNKEDLAKKLDEILLSYAKKQKVEFSAKEETAQKVGFKKLPVSTTAKRSRYGGLGKTKTE